jgi:hypothetical protein
MSIATLAFGCTYSYPRCLPCVLTSQIHSCCSFPLYKKPKSKGYTGRHFHWSSIGYPVPPADVDLRNHWDLGVDMACPTARKRPYRSRTPPQLECHPQPNFHCPRSPNHFTHSRRFDQRNVILVVHPWSIIFLLFIVWNVPGCPLGVFQLLDVAPDESSQTDGERAAGFRNGFHSVQVCH